MELPDVHKDMGDLPRIEVERVGVKGVKVPLKVARKGGSEFVTVATVDLYCSVAPTIRGANMSRFIEVLWSVVQERDLAVSCLKTLLQEVKERLESNAASVRLAFPYIVVKPAPVTKLEGPLPVDVIFEGELKGSRVQLWMTVIVPYTSLCPCSLELTGRRGAHNQRSFATVKLRLTDELIWIEEIVELVERHASAPIFTLLKRPDEKWVTECAMENPRFVEDICRLIADELKQWIGSGRIRGFWLCCEHDESIHVHRAVAEISSGDIV